MLIAYGSKFLSLKADTLYLSEKFRKKFRFEETLNKVSKDHRQQIQDLKTII